MNLKDRVKSFLENQVNVVRPTFIGSDLKHTLDYINQLESKLENDKKPLQDLDEELREIAKSVDKDVEKLVKKVCKKISEVLKEHNISRVDISQDMRGYTNSSAWDMSKARVFELVKSTIAFRSAMASDGEEFRELKDL